MQLVYGTQLLIFFFFLDDCHPEIQSGRSITVTTTNAATVHLITLRANANAPAPTADAAGKQRARHTQATQTRRNQKQMQQGGYPRKHARKHARTRAEGTTSYEVGHPLRLRPARQKWMELLNNETDDGEY